MDPYYFLDLQLEPDETDESDESDESDEEIQLHDLIEESPWGHWDLDTKGTRNSIIYKEEYYSRITFDNDNKIFTFYRGEVIAKSFKLTLVEM